MLAWSADLLTRKGTQYLPARRQCASLPGNKARGLLELWPHTRLRAKRRREPQQAERSGCFAAATRAHLPAAAPSSPHRPEPPGRPTARVLHAVLCPVLHGNGTAACPARLSFSHSTPGSWANRASISQKGEAAAVPLAARLLHDIRSTTPRLQQHELGAVDQRGLFYSQPAAPADWALAGERGAHSAAIGCPSGVGGAGGAKGP